MRISIFDTLYIVNTIHIIIAWCIVARPTACYEQLQHYHMECSIIGVFGVYSGCSLVLCCIKLIQLCPLLPFVDAVSNTVVLWRSSVYISLGRKLHQVL